MQAAAASFTSGNISKGTGLNRVSSHDGSTLLRAHPSHKTHARQASAETRIPDYTQPTYAVKAAGFQIREHKIRSRLIDPRSDVSGDEEPPHTASTHSKFVMYQFAIASPDGKTSTIFRRYRDCEDLNELLPASVQHAARLPGRRYWTRLTNSRFTSKAILDRQVEVASYLERLLSIVPDYQVVQMFICDDWLARDTAIRQRQHARVVSHKRRLVQLIAQRQAWEQKEQRAAAAEVNITTGASASTPAAVVELKSRTRPYVPSRLGPKSLSTRTGGDENAAPTAPTTTLSAALTGKDAKSAPVIAHKDSAGAACGLAPIHPRVLFVQEDLMNSPSADSLVSVTDDPDKIVRVLGTPPSRKWLRFPRAPLTPDQ